MKPLDMEDIRRAVRGRWLSGPGRGEVRRVTTDSRDARPGDLFVALKGEHFDGHAFLSAAAAAGCAAAVVQRDTEVPPGAAGALGGGVIGVEDTVGALGELAAWYRGQVPARVIAVTGSNGKTTVKEMIHAVLSRRWKGSRSAKSFNNSIGLPLTLLGAEAGDDYVVCEIGTNAPGEVSALAAIAAPDVAVITSVAEAHLEGLGSLEKIAAEKASILGALDAKGAGVVWADSDVLDRAVRQYPARRIRFGLSEDADLRLTACLPSGRGVRFQVNGRLWVDLPLPGRHNAVNALAALAVARRLGMDEARAAEALAETPPVPMRTEWIDAGGVTVINDAYNANPASVLAAVEVLAGATGGRRVLALGDMCELGPRAEELHRRLGADLAGGCADLLIAVGPLGRYIAQGAAAGPMVTVTFDSAAEAAAHVPGLLRDGDVVLIKGSRATGMEVLVAPIVSAFAPGDK